MSKILHASLIALQDSSLPSNGLAVNLLSTTIMTDNNNRLTYSELGEATTELLSYKTEFS